ncbi:sensor histidine kinase KdpD [Synechococcus sp. PCC 7336]|uniref:sensor histidine kinase n=1 Tax=Synechococcus sp. PCC 7336 TaxID=195250 RepID=UPI00138B101F|nr:ATP-binding protein [Synechococcus sp. PCC 7336]
MARRWGVVSLSWVRSTEGSSNMRDLATPEDLSGVSLSGDRVALPSSISAADLQSPQSSDIEAVCRRQAVQLSDSLAALAVRLVFARSSRLKLPTIAACHPEFEEKLLPPLPPEKIARLPAMELLAIDRSSSDRRPLAPSVYLYRFDSLGPPDPSYLLVCTPTALTNRQTVEVEQQAQLLQDYLVVCCDRDRHRQQSQALELTLQQGEHQLRNLMALAALQAENLFWALPAGPLQEQASALRTTASQLGDRIEQWLRQAPVRALQLARHDLNEMAEEAIALLEPSLTAKHLHIRYSNTSVLLAVDRTQIVQVFENLFSNAISFSPPNTTIDCKWQIFRREVAIDICDCGPGLSEQDLTSVFLPHYSRRPGGTGMGLTIAKRIVREHRGDIWCQQIPTGGAQFSFTLSRELCAPLASDR